MRMIYLQMPTIFERMEELNLSSTECVWC